MAAVLSILALGTVFFTISSMMTKGIEDGTISNAVLFTDIGFILFLCFLALKGSQMQDKQILKELEKENKQS